MRNRWLPAALILFSFQAAGQTNGTFYLAGMDHVYPASQLAADSIALLRLPRYKLPAALKSTYMPYRVDNSRSYYFPPIITQYGWSCNQSSSIAYIFTYEMNVVRRQSAGKAENRLSLFYPWNMFNSGLNNVGVSYFDSWDLVKAIGCPSELDFGYGTGVGSDDHLKWMNGYNKYYSGMQNRIEGVYSIDLGTEDGLFTLKRWMVDHGGDYEPGGLANFQIASANWQFVTLPEGTEEEGKKMIVYFSPAVGHAMTFVGYNDSVKYDFNRDGSYTNHIDITGDGKVTMADWEIGALICVNTYGRDWGNEGRVFVPYSLLTRYHTSGGIWMRSAVITKVKNSYKPRLTMRVRMSHPNRSKVWITAGVSPDPNAREPEFVLDQPVFRFQGGNHPMQGTGTGDRSKIELGIDASPLLNHIEPGKEAAFFLVVNQRGASAPEQGNVEFFTFFDYTHGIEEHYGDAYYAPINKDHQVFRVVFAPEHAPPAITTPDLPGALAGHYYSVQLEADGGTPPYHWLPVGQSFTEEEFAGEFPMITEAKVLPVVGNHEKISVNLPFEFPYFSRKYSRMTIHTTGSILFETSSYNYPYAIEQKKLLALHKGLFPFYNQQLQLPHFQDWVYYQADSSVAFVRWNASIIVNNKNSDVNFAAKLYPDGVVEYYYGFFEHSPGGPWLVGLAGGSEHNFFNPDVNFQGVREGSCIRITPMAFPQGMTLSAEGLLSGIPVQAGGFWKLPVNVEDFNGLCGSRIFDFATGTLSTGPATNPRGDVLIFPNPMTAAGWIQVQSPGPGEINLSLFDLDGRLAFSRLFKIETGTTRIPFPEAAALEDGIYIYRISGVAGGRGKILIGRLQGGLN